MPIVHLVRHGQARFGTDDYDALSDLGVRQAQIAGRERVRRGVANASQMSGTLQRQRHTVLLLAEELGLADVTPDVDPRVNEFDAHALVDQRLGRVGATDGMTSQEFQVHLDDELRDWIVERPDQWGYFALGAVEAVAEFAATVPRGGTAVIATSAGVTAAVCGTLLDAGPEGVIAMNRVSTNASITTLLAGSRGLSLLTFNDHAHFAHDRSLQTYR